MSLIRNIIFLIVGGFFVILISGCTPPAVPYSGDTAVVPKLNSDTTITQIPGEMDFDNMDYSNPERQNFRPREPFPDNPNANLGTLWKDETSWGNLFRSSKGQYVGDLVQIKNISQLVPKINNHSALDKEIIDIQNNISEISAEVVKAAPNGNVTLYAEKIDYKEGDGIRYITTIKGVARKVDISKDNQVDAKKISNVEFKTTKAYKLSDFDDIRQKELKKILDALDAEQKLFEATNNVKPAISPAKTAPSDAQPNNNQAPANQANPTNRTVNPANTQNNLAPANPNNRAAAPTNTQSSQAPASPNNKSPLPANNQSNQLPNP